jgi:hypothetical protein
MFSLICEIFLKVNENRRRTIGIAADRQKEKGDKYGYWVGYDQITLCVYIYIYMYVYI